MKSTPALLAVRARMKTHQPLFVVKEHHKSARIKRRWRAQRGIHSGHRQMYRGKPAQPTPGFGVPQAVRGVHSSGLRAVVVYSPAQLELINPQTQGVLIGSTVGMRKKMQLVIAAMKRKITVLQMKDPSAALEGMRSSFAARIKAKTEKRSAKLEKDNEKKKKAEQKKKEEEQKKKESPVAPAEEKPGEKRSSIEETVAAEEQQRQKKEQEQQEAEKILIKPH